MELSILLILLGIAIEILAIAIIVLWEMREQTSIARKSLVILQAIATELPDDSQVESREVDAELIEVGNQQQVQDSDNLHARMAQSNSVWEEDALEAEELEQL